MDFLGENGKLLYWLSIINAVRTNAIVCSPARAAASLLRVATLYG